MLWPLGNGAGFENQNNAVYSNVLLPADLQNSGAKDSWWISEFNGSIVMDLLSRSAVDGCSIVVCFVGSKGIRTVACDASTVPLDGLDAAMVADSETQNFGGSEIF